MILLALCAYSTSRHIQTQATPSSLVNGVQKVVLVNVDPLCLISLYEKLKDPHNKIYDTNALKERREDAKGRW